MSSPARTRTSKPPAERRVGATYFYPAEAARILGLDGIDYHQLRRLFTLVRKGREEPEEKRWSRFEFRDLVALRVAVRLIGGVDVIRSGDRLRFVELERACDRLRQLGAVEPLLEVDLRADGSQIIATVDGVRFRPADGQLQLPDTMQRVDAYLKSERVMRKFPITSIRRDLKATRSAVEALAVSTRRIRPTGTDLRI